MGDRLTQHIDRLRKSPPRFYFNQRVLLLSIALCLLIGILELISIVKSLDSIFQIQEVQGDRNNTSS